MRGCSDRTIQALAAAAGYLNQERDVARHAVTLPPGFRLYDVGSRASHIYFTHAPAHMAGIAAVYAQVVLPSPDGKAALKFDRVDEGRVIGEFEWLAAGLVPGHGAVAAPKRESFAELLTPAQVIALPWAAVAEAQDARLARRFVGTGVNRLRDRLNLETRAWHRGGDVALAEYLMRFADDFGENAGSFTGFSKKLRQEDMAKDLGISRRALSDRLKAWSEAGLIRTTPFCLLDVDRIEQLRRVGAEPPNAVIAAVSARLDALLERGNLASAQRVALDLLAYFPLAPDLLWRAGLAAAKAGRATEAKRALAGAGLDLGNPARLRHQVLLGLVKPQASMPPHLPELADLRDVVEDWSDDGQAQSWGEIDAKATEFCAELGALAARMAKDDALVKGGEALRRAAEAYEGLSQGGSVGAGYGDINAASLRLAAGEEAAACELARRAQGAISGRSYWRHATEMEAALVLGDETAALKASQAAMACAPSDGALASTRRQLRLFERAFGPAAMRCRDALKPRAPLVYSGTMVHAGQFEGADPDTIVAHMTDAARAFFAETAIAGAFGPLAQGGDIVVAEAALDAGVELHIVLPFSPAAYIEASVATDPRTAPDWTARFHAVIDACASVTIGHHGTPFRRDLSVTFRHGFRLAAAKAIAQAGDLEAEPLLLAIRAEGEGGALAGTNADVEDWRGLNLPIHEIMLPFKKLKASGPDKIAHGFGPVVFLFPERDAKAEPESLAKSAATASGVAGHYMDRRRKGGRGGGAMVMESTADALKLARTLLDDARADLRVICDYGPLISQSGKPSPELLAALPGAADFADMPSDRVLATDSFAAELVFAQDKSVCANRVGQRLFQSEGAGAARILPSFGVFELTWRG